jgi:hypothetical protein
VYLVHVQFRTNSHHSLPADVDALVAACAEAADRVEYVVLHRLDDGAAVVGLFLLAPSLAVAEGAAEAVCRRALAVVPELADCILDVCEAPLIPVDPGTGRLMPWTDEDSQDHFRFP